MDDNIIEAPAHYTGWPIEPVDFIMRNELDFVRGNIIKYTVRAGLKLYPGKDRDQSAVTDFKKVIRYVEMEINRLEGKEDL